MAQEWLDQGTRRVNAARALRKSMSDSERKLWSILRRDQLGVRVRRQHPVGPFVLDFYIPSRKLAIEVDGDLHSPSSDARRDAYLERLGIRTLRIPSMDLFDDERRVAWIETIASIVDSR